MWNSESRRQSWFCYGNDERSKVLKRNIKPGANTLVKHMKINIHQWITKENLIYMVLQK